MNTVLNPTEKCVLTSLYSILIVSGSYGNLCVIFGILSCRRNRQRPSNVFNVGLAVCDLFSCCCIGSFQLFSLLTEGTIESSPVLTCQNWIVIMYSLQGISILSLSIICADRFIALRFPYGYGSLLTLKRAVFVVLLCWLESIFTFLPLGVVNGWTSYEKVEGISCGVVWKELPFCYILFIGILNLFMPGFVVTASNCVVFRIARSQSRKLLSLKSRFSCAPSKENATVERSSGRLQRKVGVVLYLSRFYKGVRFRSKVLPNLPTAQSEVITPSHHILRRDTASKGDRKRFKEILRRERSPFPTNILTRLKISTEKNRNDSATIPFETANLKTIADVSVVDSSAKLDSQVNIEFCEIDAFENATPNQQASHLEGNLIPSSTPNQQESHLEGNLIPSIVGSSDKTRGLSADSSSISVLHFAEKSTQEEERKEPKARISSSEWRIASSTLLIVICFVLSYSPWVIARLSLMLTSVNYKAIIVTSFVALASSLWNSCIVLTTRSDIRKHAKKYIYC